MKNVYVYAYSQHSAAGRSLAKSLQVPFIRHEGSKFLARRSKTVINWGASNLPDFVRGAQVVNSPEDVYTCVDKLLFFERMTSDGEGNPGPRVVPWTTDVEQALEWVEDNKTVVARTKLKAYSGDGIEFLDRENFSKYAACRLFTLYKPKRAEFRVHIFGGKVLDVQQKLLRKTDEAGTPIDPKSVDFRIRNLKNGFIFGRNEIKVPEDVITNARLAHRKTGLLWCAIDMIWNEKEQKSYVLEANTAPGLQGTTLDNYTHAFEEYFS